MKKLKVKVKLKSRDSEIDVSAIEHDPEKVHYGNGIYITILRNERVWGYVDMRYKRYFGLQDFLNNYLLEFFGEELEYIREVE